MSLARVGSWYGARASVGSGWIQVGFVRIKLLPVSQWSPNLCCGALPLPLSGYPHTQCNRTVLLGTLYMPFSFRLLAFSAFFLTKPCMQVFLKRWARTHFCTAGAVHTAAPCPQVTLAFQTEVFPKVGDSQCSCVVNFFPRGFCKESSLGYCSIGHLSDYSSMAFSLSVELINYRRTGISWQYLSSTL